MNLPFISCEKKPAPTIEELTAFAPEFFPEAKETFEKLVGVSLELFLLFSGLSKLPEVLSSGMAEMKYSFHVQIGERFRLIRCGSMAPNISKDRIHHELNSARRRLLVGVMIHLNENGGYNPETDSHKLPPLHVTDKIVRDSAAESIGMNVFIDSDLNCWYGSPELEMKPHRHEETGGYIGYLPGPSTQYFEFESAQNFGIYGDELRQYGRFL